MAAVGVVHPTAVSKLSNSVWLRSAALEAPANLTNFTIQVVREGGRRLQSPPITVRIMVLAMAVFLAHPISSTISTRCRIHGRKTSRDWDWAATRRGRRFSGTRRPMPVSREANHGCQWRRLSRAAMSKLWALTTALSNSLPPFAFGQAGPRRPQQRCVSADWRAGQCTRL